MHLQSPLLVIITYAGKLIIYVIFKIYVWGVGLYGRPVYAINLRESDNDQHKICGIILWDSGWCSYGAYAIFK